MDMEEYDDLPVDLSVELTEEDQTKLEKLNTALKKVNKDRVIEMVFRLAEYIMATQNDHDQGDVQNITQEKATVEAQLQNVTQEKSALEVDIQNVTQEKATVEAKLQNVTQEKSALEVKLQKTVDDLVKYKVRVKEHEEVKQHLENKLCDRKPGAATVKESVKPNVLLITDSTVLSDKLNAKNNKWTYLLIENIKTAKGLAESAAPELNEADLIIVQMGREEIYRGAEAADLAPDLIGLIQEIQKLDIPFRVSQILPVKGLDKRTEINLLNRMIENTTEWNPILISTFNGCVESEMFHQMKLNIRDSLLNEAVAQFETRVGTPKIRDKQSDTTPVTTSQNSETILELLPLLREHAYNLLKNKSEKIRALQTSFKGSQISVIKYDFKETKKNAVLVKGDYPLRQQIKSQVAALISSFESDGGTKRSGSDDPTGWAKKFKQ